VFVITSHDIVFPNASDEFSEDGSLFHENGTDEDPEPRAGSWDTRRQLN
jgi:hypothetical protein